MIGRPMVSEAIAVRVAYLALLTGFPPPLQAATLSTVSDEAMLTRAGRGAAAGEAVTRGAMVDLDHLIRQHAASEPELHARAAETWRRFAAHARGPSKTGCTYIGGLMSCPPNHVCYYTGRSGLNVDVTIEYRGNIIRVTLHPDPDAGVDQPDLVIFMGANTNDVPAMLLDVPQNYRRTSDPLMLKMFFLEDDDVNEECPSDNLRRESTGNGIASYEARNESSLSVQTEGPDLSFMGMTFDMVSQTLISHTDAFEIPAGTQIVSVSRAEMAQVLTEQELPVSTEERLLAAAEAKARAADGSLDGATLGKSSRRRRRRRAPRCNSEQVGLMVGGVAIMAAAFAVCAFTFIGCFAFAPMLITVGGATAKNGACKCWANKGKPGVGDAACALR